MIAPAARRRGIAGRVGRSRDAEVGDDRLLVVRDQNVGRLQIAVDDADFVRRLQAGDDLTRQRDRPFDRQLPLGRQQAREVGAVHERHRDVFDAVDLAEVVDANDVGVRDLSGQHQLALEPPLQLLDRQRIGLGLE